MRKSLIIILAAALAALSCEEIVPYPKPEGGTYNRVVILASMGFNDLDTDLRADIEDILGKIPNTSLPSAGGKDAFIIFEHTTAAYHKYNIKTSPHIINVTRDFAGRAVLDTLKTFGEGTFVTDKGTIKEALSFICQQFPCDHYGLIISSHGSGWLPEKYYHYNKLVSGTALTSVGQEFISEGGKMDYDETDIRDLVTAIPMHLDYLLFDACLMGGIEVAYELRDKADIIGMSAAEIYADGFDYEKMLDRLLGSGDPDPEAVCRDYFEHADEGTICCLKTDGLEHLASISKDLFSRYRDGLSKIKWSNVQGYFRNSRHYFYDFLDILDKAGVSEADRSEVAEALNSIILYKNASPWFDTIQIRTFCGLSMYLPAHGKADLVDYYKTLEWNKATGLVE